MFNPTYFYDIWSADAQVDMKTCVIIPVCLEAVSASVLTDRMDEWEICVCGCFAQVISDVKC